MLLRDLIVGRVNLDSARTGHEDGEPGVGCVGALELGLPQRRECLQITTDVGGSVGCWWYEAASPKKVSFNSATISPQINTFVVVRSGRLPFLN